jgi:hypothetical protein
VEDAAKYHENEEMCSNVLNEWISEDEECLKNIRAKKAKEIENYDFI